ncbi:hypothetical protein [Novosphingobium sp. NDB2Meth1]|uniref:hypothetical protein n=1 Tax=Novosphingobium sp. NDB2Meth1 TaxID=1892847 RepID=UPI00093031C2|nr:hypothetical protein [Novosphingobium sp. NDB2Meth1]
MSRILGTYALKYAIVRETRATDGETREEVLKPTGFEVIVRRPQARHMKLMDGYQDREIHGSIALLAQISNLDADELDLIDAEDFGALGNLLGSGSGSGQPTGVAA